MSIWQDRLRVEEIDLNTKLESLSSFLDTNEYRALEGRNQDILSNQFNAMSDYHAILLERVAQL